MSSLDSISRMTARGITGASASFAVAMLASVVVFVHRAEPCRVARMTSAVDLHAAWIAVSVQSVGAVQTVCVDALAARGIGLEVRAVSGAGCAAQVRHLRELAVSRIGGLHGP